MKVFVAQEICYPAQHAFLGQIDIPEVIMRMKERYDFGPDQKLFEAVRGLVPMPEGVEAVVFEEGEDSDGDPAAWIWVCVKPQLNPSNERVKVLNAYTTRMRNELLDRGMQCFPYVRIAEYKPRVSERQRAAGR